MSNICRLEVGSAYAWLGDLSRRSFNEDGSLGEDGCRPQPAATESRPTSWFFMEDKQKSTVQLIWGILLLIAGIGVFFRIPQLMPKIKEIEHFDPYIIFIYFCFYLLGILLIVGGGKKVYQYLKESKQNMSND